MEEHIKADSDAACLIHLVLPLLQENESSFIAYKENRKTSI